ncbi:MAG: hypothetical protein LH478_12985 [Chitinophagaceae bacterium]|nr:hypothetical protein [Chitinophagaceae bacterium]
MQVSHDYFIRFSKFLLLLALVSVHEQTTGQAKMRARTLTNQNNAVRLATDSPSTKRNVEIQNNKTISASSRNIVAMGNETDGYAYLQSKKYCGYEKSVDDEGCVVIQYVDGGAKKLCNDMLVEVMTPDGIKHPIRTNSIQQYVMKLDPPNNPPQTDVTYKWISGFNAEELNEISKLLKTDAAINQYLKREYANCKDNVYKQMEYRSIFLQEYYKAK